jgi:dTDP-D-glucose 4,6-dehydratase
MIGKNDPIYVAGHTGLIGSAIMRALAWEPRVLLADGLRTTYAWYTRTLTGQSN